MNGPFCNISKREIEEINNLNKIILHATVLSVGISLTQLQATKGIERHIFEDFFKELADIKTRIDNHFEKYKKV
jgi:hypothetical protein